MLRSLLFLAVLVSTAAVPAAQAQRQGGGSDIASASTVAVGQTQYGDTSHVYFNYRPSDFWKLNLTAADKVTIDWESNQASNSCGGYWFATYLDVYPAGTTDFSINNASPIDGFQAGDNGKAESSFTATQSGAYPLLFTAGCSDAGQTYGGPYDFTVTVQHALVFKTTVATQALFKKARRSRINHTGRLVFNATAPDGSPITGGVGATVRGYWAGKWHVIGRGASANGTLTVRYKLPKTLHARIRVIVNAGGPNYQGKSILWKRVTV